MSILRLAHRSTRTVAIFLVSLCALLAISTEFVLPQLASVSVQNTTYQVHTVGEYYTELEQSIASLAERRLQLLEPVPNVDYRNAVLARHTNTSVTSFLQFSAAIESDFTLSGMPLIAMDSRSGTIAPSGAIEVTLVGRIINAQDRSLSVLSSFIGAIEDDSRVTKVEHDGFSRVTTTDGMQQSPFTLRITL